MKRSYYLLVVIIIILCSCDNKNTRQSVSNSTSKSIKSEAYLTKEKDKHCNKIDLDKILAQSQNKYLANFDNGNLDMCGYYLIDITNKINFRNFVKTQESYELDNSENIVNVYRKDSSFVKTYFNKHPRMNQLDIVCGVIYDNDLINHNFLKLGIAKDELLTNYFCKSNMLKKINSLTIWENELGDAFTSYKFLNDTLKAIEFNSSYEWINKE